MLITVTKQDPRYEILKKSRNLRWSQTKAEEPSQVDLCDGPEAVAEALQKILDRGMRPTIRSGGHCYEDFVVTNPGGAILDLSILRTSRLPSDGSQYRISPGMMLGEVYTDLYKRYGLTIPAGTCYTVGAGGHISGGGYGLLSRLHGLTVDWLSAVEIITVNGAGHVQLRRVDKTKDPDLFRACRGAGGGTFGVITGFLFDKLPTAPTEVATGGLGLEWRNLDEDKFVRLLTTFGEYWENRGTKSDTLGFFAALQLTHASSGRLGVNYQFCNPDGTCRDLSVLHEFLKLFEPFEGTPGHAVTGDSRVPAHNTGRRAGEDGNSISIRPWLDATVGGNVGTNSGRAKYKSAYMKKNFTVDEAKRIYKHLTDKEPEAHVRNMVLAVDSYGGETNRPELGAQTSICQRASIMKLQYQSYWREAELDAPRLKWLADFYNDVYSTSNVDSRYASTPFPGKYYEGCYINYPDRDMLAHDFWPELYYGNEGLYPFLQDVKRRYDANNVFHHAMSVRT